MRTFWEKESVPYAFEEEPRRLFRLLNTCEEEVTGGRATHILSQARPVTEEEATGLRKLMPAEGPSTYWTKDSELYDFKPFYHRLYKLSANSKILVSEGVQVEEMDTKYSRLTDAEGRELLRQMRQQ